MHRNRGSHNPRFRASPLFSISEDLAAVAQRPLREQADLKEAVENHTGGAYPPHLSQHHVHGLAELESGGMDETATAWDRGPAQAGRVRRSPGRPMTNRAGPPRTEARA